MPRKWLFQDRLDSECQEGVLNDKVDKHYARCVASNIQLIFFNPYCCYGPYKIYLALVHVPGNHVASKNNDLPFKLQE